VLFDLRTDEADLHVGDVHPSADFPCTFDDLPKASSLIPRILPTVPTQFSRGSIQAMKSI
jgi:hypothetical protein